MIGILGQSRIKFVYRFFFMTDQILGSWVCHAVTYTGGLGELPSDVDELVLQGFLFEVQLFHGQRLVMIQLHLLMSCHQGFL